MVSGIEKFGEKCTVNETSLALGARFCIIFKTVVREIYKLAVSRRNLGILIACVYSVRLVQLVSYRI